jgi:hypothetical protein
MAQVEPGIVTAVLTRRKWTIAKLSRELQRYKFGNRSVGRSKQHLEAVDAGRVVPGEALAAALHELASQ